MSIEAAFFGTLGRDAESKTSKSGKPYLRLNVRVGDGDGATWVSVMSFDEKALEIADKLLKGVRVYVEGSIKIGEWKGQDGTTRHGLSCMSWHTRLSEIGRNKPKSKRENAASGRQVAAASVHAPSAAEDGINDDLPF